MLNEMLWFFVVIPLIVKECERTSNGLRLRVFDEQVMLKHRDAEIVEITYLNQGVDLRGFLWQRKFIVIESVVLCDAVNRNKGTVVMLNDQMCQETQGSQSKQTTTTFPALTTTFNEIAALSFMITVMQTGERERDNALNITVNCFLF